MDLTLVFFFWHQFAPKDKKLVPTVFSWVPFMGNAIEFGK